MSRILRSLTLAGLLAFPADGLALSIAIDLTTFDVVPASSVSFSAGGNTASLIEDNFFSFVSLEKLSFYVPSGSERLEVAYTLHVADSNEDYFDVYFGDLSSPVFSDGGAPGDYSGYLTVDLASFSNTTVPLVFALASGFVDAGTGSSLQLTSAQIVSASAVPEGGMTLGYLLLSLLSIERLRRRA
jgi:hypothetical protein